MQDPISSSSTSECKVLEIKLATAQEIEFMTALPNLFPRLEYSLPLNEDDRFWPLNTSDIGDYKFRYLIKYCQPRIAGGSLQDLHVNIDFISSN
jgi:hypothetical protein